MPVLVPRAPLDPLTNMNASSAARGKRKPVKLNFLDEEEAPAKKKARSDDGTAMVAERVNSENRDRAGGSIRAKGKHDADLGGKVYEESSDGFRFSRKQARRKKSLTPPKEEEPLKRRRSARLSGEKDKDRTEEKGEAPKPSRPKRAEAPAPQPPAGKGSPEAGAGGLQVGKKSRDGTKIALPFADTPVMRRNKEMREKGKRAGSGARRSSAGMRGRRASSLIESGQSNGECPRRVMRWRLTVTLQRFRTATSRFATFTS